MDRKKDESEPGLRDHPWRSRLMLAAACLLLLCYLVSENLFNYACITNGINPDWRKSAARGLSWLLMPGVFLFPVGLAFAARRLLLSEKWLLLIAECALFELPLCFGFQNPYVDSQFFDRPLMRFYDEMCVWFIAAAILQGPLLALFHCLWRDKDRAAASLARRIASFLAAVLLSAALAASFFLESPC